MRGHSPLGGSSMSRAIKCPGSVALSFGVVEEESEHAGVGTAAHKLAEVCLKTGEYAWVYITHVESSGPAVDKGMADAVQVYLDAVRKAHPDRHQGNTWIERPFHCPTLHEYYWGASDLSYLDEAMKVLHVWDYKHGIGVIVEVKDNVQGRYYACGMLEELGLWDTVTHVTIHIAQPRAFHMDGPIREITYTVAELDAWLFDELIPAMDRALVSRDTVSGQHCRFCPVRGMDCPQMAKDENELEGILIKLTTDDAAKKLKPEQVARTLDLMEVMKIRQKAVSSVGFGMLQSGNVKLPGWKLTKAKSNREWKPEAEAELVAKFGKDTVFSKPELIGPAKVDDLPEGKAMTARFAFKPDKGLTMVRDDDARPAVNRDTKSLFKDTTKKGK